MAIPDKEVLTLRETALVLGEATETVARKIEDPEAGYSKFVLPRTGRRWRISRRLLEQYLAGELTSDDGPSAA